ncbi:hypothetical protein OE88DRAFT_1657290 [Heliocybe sulcata]|uniref:Protein kinase domain-containing protein n=1 Tax=Heliocybe sulcata TaxID=5364 RepID=A0A5C3N8D4_9AGAM|nr:hypothetical protein OE88DRAFT_1657290 [Heliocybe sulcata]
MNPPQIPQDATDIFSISDEVLEEQFQFIEEIGFGNWGSVWLCRPKEDLPTEVHESLQRAKVAVKLVHRSKTSTSAARFKSLWNEMKIVRALKEGHPAIISFYSLVITPRYAMITMAHHPRLMPVQIPEHHSREWFRLLLSGVEFLHRRGVVHNDIKPANILLSKQNVPVLIDFGFAEKYDPQSSKAFLSDLAYGTPEYLSPERARGLPHDTRKSDIWSLGITFFEILTGRTPFEYNEGEQFSTKADLERYWARTMKGKWVGTWKMSKGIERLLKKMTLPNADLRITSSQAFDDPYWTKDLEPPVSAHKRTASGTPSFVDIISPFSTHSRPARVRKRFHANDEEAENVKPGNLDLPPGLDEAKLAKVQEELGPIREAQQRRSRSQSRPRVLQDRQPSRGPLKARVPTIRIAPDLPPMKGSPPVTPARKVVSSRVATARKENAAPRAPGVLASARRPAGPRAPVSPKSGLAVTSASYLNRQAPFAEALPYGKASKVKDTPQRPKKVLGDVMHPNGKDESVDEWTGSAGKQSVKALQRVNEWERERQRLRELERLRDTEEEGASVNVEPVQERPETKAVQEKVNFGEDSGSEKENRDQVSVLPSSRSVSVGTRSVSGSTWNAFDSTRESSPSDWDGSPASPTPSLSGFKHSLRTSIDKTVRSAKSSVLALGRMSTPALTLSGGEESVSLRSRESWEEAIIREAGRTLPARVKADNESDGMAVWMQNVEKVVEQTRARFAITQVLPQVPLAPATKPVARAASMSSRKMLPANKIFACDDEDDVKFDRLSTSRTSRHSSPANAILDQNAPSIPEEKSVTAPEIKEAEATNLRRPRRNTVGTRSPEVDATDGIDQGSPSKRREKSRSHGDLLRPISPLEQLEIDQRIVPSPRLPLSSLLDSSLFIASPIRPSFENTAVPTVTLNSPACEEPDDLAAEPFLVEPYASRQRPLNAETTMDSPTRRHVEGVYDRFLMATSGVKRAGRGYQSNCQRPLGDIVTRQSPAPKRDRSFFPTSRRPLPPPVSSDDLRRAASIDELGLVARTAPVLSDEERKHSVRLMGALKAMLTGKQTSRRSSRLL